MTAVSSRGEPKLLEECTYPLTASGVVDVIVTELSVFRVRAGALVLTELLGEATVEDVRTVTAAEFAVELDA
jgi:acyl CoA:acetate/3-ketoacid CoA transferase beta subunit